MYIHKAQEQASVLLSVMWTHVHFGPRLILTQAHFLAQAHYIYVKEDIQSYLGQVTTLNLFQELLRIMYTLFLLVILIHTSQNLEFHRGGRQCDVCKPFGTGILAQAFWPMYILGRVSFWPRHILWPRHIIKEVIQSQLGQVTGLCFEFVPRTFLLVILTHTL